MPNNSGEASRVIGDLHGCNSEQSLTHCGYRYALNLLHYYTTSRCAGTSTGKGKYKSQLQVTSYPFPQACCISKSKLTGRTNQLELLGNNHSRPFRLQPYARQREVPFPLVSAFTLSLLPQLQSYLDQGCDGRNWVALFMLGCHGILLYIRVSEWL